MSKLKKFGWILFDTKKKEYVDDGEGIARFDRKDMAIDDIRGENRENCIPLRVFVEVKP